jgi:ssDNA-binding Zn-finger/Zn-ribbon topoisomerase 1
MTGAIKCPICGSRTRLRTSKKDGSKFHVCIHSPECIGKVPYDDEWQDDKPRIEGAFNSAAASVAVGVVGCFGLGIILGPIAIALAIRARRNVRLKPSSGSEEQEVIAGFTFGIIGIVVSLILIYFLIIWTVA